jgi:hypothetical protein
VAPASIAVPCVSEFGLPPPVYGQPYDDADAITPKCS